MAFTTPLATVTQSLSPTGGTTSGINTTGANLIVAAVSLYSGYSGLTFADSKSNTWTYLGIQSLGDAWIAMYFCVPSSVGSGHTFTVGGSNVYSAVSVQAWSGAYATPYTRRVNKGGSPDSSTVLVNPVTPSEDGCLIVTAVSDLDAVTGRSINASFTISGEVALVGGNSYSIGMAYRVMGSQASVSPTWTRPGSVGYMNAMQVVFLPAEFSATWVKGFNFRTTSGYVTDEVDQTYVLGPTIPGDSEAYPTTRNGVTFGWTTQPNGAADRSAANIPELAGTAYVTGADAVFRVDLPNSGTYKLRLAMGDETSSQPDSGVTILDNVTPVLTLAGQAVVATQWVDATNVSRDDVDWLANEGRVSGAFAGSVLNMRLDQPSSGYTVLAHLGVQSVPESARRFLLARH